MSKCLVTKLSKVVNDDKFGFLGGIRLTFPKSVEHSSAYASLRNKEQINFDVAKWLKGSSQPIVSNFGNVQVKTSGVIDDILLVKEKYNVNSISMQWGGAKVYIEDLFGMEENLTSIDFGVGQEGDDLSDLPDLKNLEVIAFGNIAGDISKLNKFTSLTTISEQNVIPTKSLVYGELSSLRSLFLLKKFVVPSNVSGYLSDLRCYSTLETFTQPDKKRKDIVDSDASLWASQFSALRSVISWGSKLVWSSSSLRPSTMPLINAQVGFASPTDCDNYIINMASCSSNGLNTDANKTIYLQQATRTSASDNAISTLSANGWTVSGVTKV